MHHILFKNWLLCSWSLSRQQHWALRRALSGTTIVCTGSESDIATRASPTAFAIRKSDRITRRRPGMRLGEVRLRWDSGAERYGIPDMGRQN